MTRYYKPAAQYEVISPGHGLIGHIRRSVLVLLGETEGYSGVVHYRIEQGSRSHPYGGQPYVARRYGPPLGRLEGLEIVSDDGSRLHLRQIPRQPAVPACPVMCRVLLDLRQVLAEQEQPGAYLLSGWITAAPFDECPTCAGVFGLVDDCAECGGYGVVPEV